MEIGDQPGAMHRLFKTPVEFLHLRAGSDFREEVFAQHVLTPTIRNLFLARVVEENLALFVNDDDAIRQEIERREIHFGHGL
jgi:hypothetical protein